MKTKKRAIRRVTCVPSLDHVDVAQFPEEKECATLDLGLDNMVTAIGGVDVCLDRLSKRVCKDTPVASHVSSDIHSAQYQTTGARKEPDPVFLKQPFQSMLHVPDGGTVEGCSSDFECSAITSPPVQITGAYHVCCALPFMFYSLPF